MDKNPYCRERFFASLRSAQNDRHLLQMKGGKPGRFAATFLYELWIIQNAPASLSLHLKCNVISNEAKTELAKVWRNEKSFSFDNRITDQHILP